MEKTNRQLIIEFYIKGLISTSDWLYLFKNHRELNEVPLDPEECIGVAFCWADTPQGNKYWSDIDDKIREYYEQQDSGHSTFEHNRETCESLYKELLECWREYTEAKLKAKSEIEVKVPKGYVIDHIDNSDFTAKIHMKKEDRSSIESIHQLDLETLKFCRDVARDPQGVEEYFQTLINTIER